VFGVNSDDASARKVARLCAGNCAYVNKIANQKKSFEKLNNPVSFALVSSGKWKSVNEKDIKGLRRFAKHLMSV